MYDYLLTDENRIFREEVRKFVKNTVSPSLLKKMDKDEIQYPTEWLKALAKQNLIGMFIFITEYLWGSSKYVWHRRAKTKIS